MMAAELEMTLVSEWGHQPRTDSHIGLHSRLNALEIKMRSIKQSVLHVFVVFLVCEVASKLVVSK